ncbi:hypothetical protein PGT21_025076 [Puccinia graminis f. sp. tritici]|uniref:OB domain-containing protein n=1 Tax=Puccinia graminis f. sp. tritici TaxID=56615 RepID=A0A5B0ND48_PUCGR|nr:hypothetical protein PGT21_025076 [Puccinia graminis f. sp. tritici]
MSQLPTHALQLPQISGWIKIHSVISEVQGHVPTNPSSKHFVLSINDIVLKRLNPELQINSRIWINGTITRTDSKFIYVDVSTLSYSAPLN